MEGWEKVLVSNTEFFDTKHGKMGCIKCHGGDGTIAEKEQAHIDMRREPITAEACDKCHDDMENDASSLHSTLRGYYTVLQQRTSEETWPRVEEAFDNHCTSCHTSCGQCHVSQPTNLGGGLTAGHEFKKIPPMNRTCTACHGSRIDMEYKGKNEGIPPDIHWNQGGMPCFACHTADEMHGNLDFEANHRYDGSPMPDCTSGECHHDITDDGMIEGHDSNHLNTMSCQTCHAAAYKNCYSCHVQKSEEDVPYFKIEPSVMDLKIGYNPRQSEERPWKWVTLRHVPIDPNSFEYYGLGLLPNFNALSTWAYTTPHTTQLRAPQAETCNSCHGNPDVFLTRNDLLPYEVEANQGVVVDATDIPALIVK